MNPVHAALPFPDIDPVLFSIGPLAVHWYGLAYVVGILLGWRYARTLAGADRLWFNGQPAMRVADIDDFLIWAAVGIVLGGRLGYIFFYDFAAFLQNPLRMFEIWKGGMSFHGGLLGTIIAMILFARNRGISVWSLFDVIAASAPIGLFLGRLANFVNGELWGRVSDVPWAVVFPTGGPDPRHPSQLYEAVLEGPVLFFALFLLMFRFGKLKRPRYVGGAFLLGYGASRILVEFFREPDAHIGYLFGGWLTMGMILSVPMIAVGLIAMAYAKPPAQATPVRDSGSGH
ncbi:prolipoprotein diacylglyceryl transferase [Nitratireductor sp. XY-223]|uniref:prolipoprotein diacylglyceryl transferase n=1 Tax=Nitratireductor sp. XY-223 TaxID=2561926 RepID=UPI0010AACD56|nr:prolipoprotein diacylglyceryl transferase [Nitratireductor sp. XY-223]